MNNANLDFKIYTLADGKEWTQFNSVAVVDNFPEAYPSYARHTFDAYGLPEGTNYVKIEFPDYEGAEYRTASGAAKAVVNTDIQLAKVTFLQEKGAQIVEPEIKLESIKITKEPDKTEYTEGEVFDPAGVEVKAVWSDGSETDITADVTYSTDILKTTDEKVTIQYVYEEAEATVDQAITVKEKVIVDPDVKDEVTGVKVAPDTVEVKAGETRQFTVTVEGTEEISQEVTWEVLNSGSENPGKKPTAGSNYNPVKTPGTTKSAKTTNTGKTVNTGDESLILLLSIPALLSLGCAGMIVIRKKAKR